MSFFKYLLANRLWLFIGFLGVVAGFVYCSTFFGAGGRDIRGVAIAVGILAALFMGGNYVSWRKLRKR